MNKKFTFMVAALLAAGTSAFAAVNGVQFDKVVSGNCYYIVGDADGNGSSVTDSNDYYLGVGTFMATAATQAASGSLPGAVENVAAYTWRVNITEEGDKKYAEFINISTGEKLAFKQDGTLATTTADYKAGNLIDRFVISSDNKDANVLNQEIKISSAGAALSATDAAGLLFVEVAAQSYNAADIQKDKGVNFTLDFEGTPTGESVFSSVSVVTAKSGTSDWSDYNTTATTGFYLMVGGTQESFDLSKEADQKAFKAAKFVVLNTTAQKVESTTAGIGYSYEIVTGDKLIKNPTAGTEKVEAGKYPVKNAQFKANQSANYPGAMQILHESVYVTNADGKTWNQASENNLAVGLGGTKGAEVVSSVAVADAAWANAGKGTVVDVKTWLTGKKLVNVLVSAENLQNGQAAKFEHLLYSKQEQGGDATINTDAVLTSTLKSNVYSQWYVSADKNGNTVTFINRETGVDVKGVTLYNTVVNGVYGVSGNATLGNRYIIMEDVKGATETDGYLALTEDELKRTYTLSSKVTVSGFELDAALVQGTTESEIVASVEENAPAIEFALSLAKTKKNNKDVVDTAYIVTDYNFYESGALKTKSDTLKVFKYNLKAVGNVTKDYDKSIVDGFALQNTTGAAGVFVIRKSGNKYQIMKDDFIGSTVYPNANIVTYSSNKFASNGNIENAAEFTLTSTEVRPSYDFNGAHVALSIDGAYLGVNAEDGAIMTNDTSMLKSTVADASFSFFAFSADKEEALIPSYYLSSNGKLMYNPADTIAKLDAKIAATSPVDTETLAALKAERAKYGYSFNADGTVAVKALKFQSAKVESADSLTIAGNGVKGDDLKKFKFNAYENEDGTVNLVNNSGEAVSIVNNVAVLGAAVDAANFTVVSAEAPTSNEGVVASEVKVVANNGSIVVKNAAGKNVVVSTILGQVVANEVLTSDNATINVPAGIVVVAVEGESFKVNVK